MTMTTETAMSVAQATATLVRAFSATTELLRKQHTALFHASRAHYLALLAASQKGLGGTEDALYEARELCVSLGHDESKLPR